MKFRHVVSIAALVASSAALAQGGPPQGGAGGPPPGGMQGPMTSPADTPADTARKAVVQGWGDLIDQGKVDEAFERYVSKNFIEHSYMAKRMVGKDKAGWTEIHNFFKQRMGNGAPPGRKIAETLVANDEMVTIDGRIGQDIYRVVDGKIVEHWDTIHQGAGSPLNAKTAGTGTGGPPPGQ